LAGTPQRGCLLTCSAVKRVRVSVTLPSANYIHSDAKRCLHPYYSTTHRALLIHQHYSRPGGVTLGIPLLGGLRGSSGSKKINPPSQKGREVLLAVPPSLRSIMHKGMHRHRAHMSSFFTRSWITAWPDTLYFCFKRCSWGI
jgi:hypothetical protein